MNLESEIDMPLFQVLIYRFRKNDKAERSFAAAADNPLRYPWPKNAQRIIGASNIKQALDEKV